MKGVMSDYKPSKAMTRELIWAAAFETLCFAAGLVAFLATGKWIWIVMGLLAGLGFSVPAIIKFVREAKERDRASR